MKFTAAAVIAAAVSGAAAWGSNVTVTTDVVTAYTTYCPEATSITMGNKTYTVTSATTLTITDCPCTITRPVMTSRYVTCETSCAAWNATSLATSAPAAPTAPSTAPSSLPTAGAGKAAALSGAGLAGLVGLAAFAL